MKEYFKQEYMTDFSNVRQIPQYCPFCNRLLRCWHYEKAKDHIMKCTKKRSYLETPQTELSDEKEKLWIEIEQKYAR